MSSAPLRRRPCPTCLSRTHFSSPSPPCSSLAATLSSQSCIQRLHCTARQGLWFGTGAVHAVGVAQEEGFEVVGSRPRLKERAIEEAMVGTVVSERGRKWIGPTV